MKDSVYSNTELTALRERLNREIQRRGTFSWWDPLVPPTVGTDREPRRVLPEGSENDVVSDKTYTINNTSEGSLEETRNRYHPGQGDNPGGQDSDNVGNPKTSAMKLDQDEIRNYIIGLSKMHDIDLFYGRDEKPGVAFRDTGDIEKKLILAESPNSVLHVPNDEPVRRYDPNAGVKNRIIPGYDFFPAGNTYSEVTVHVKLSSDQHDGEELHSGHPGPDPTNFYDDYGAKIERTTVDQFTDAEKKTIPVINDSYQLPVQPGNRQAELDLTPGVGRPVTKQHLINYTGVSTTVGETPSGKASGGWRPTPQGTPDETLPGQLLRRSYNGGADGMKDVPLPDGKTTYNGQHPTTGVDPVNRHSFIPELKFPTGKGDQIHMAYHPQNPYVSPETTVFQIEQDDHRSETVTEVVEGNKDSIRFGLNPRNPQVGDEYSPRSYRQSYSGKQGLCNVACTGLCYQTCDSECNESCQTTCWNRCGDACISECSNVCTGCSSLCYSSCKTKCENAVGYSCLNVGAKAVEFRSVGALSNGNGTPWPRNHLFYGVHACTGCSYSCQFYPNYKTTCWDSLCQNMCFYSCYSYCSTGCYGGCIDNQSQHDHNTSPLWPKNSMETNASRYRSGRGQACREGCTADCVGICTGSCDGTCSTACFFSKCINTCFDTCNSGCYTHCGSGCASVCRSSCSGDCNGNCSGTCTGTCLETCTGSCSGSCSGSES